MSEVVHYVAEPEAHVERDAEGRYRCRAAQAVMCVDGDDEVHVVEVFEVTWRGAATPAIRGAFVDVGLIARAWAERLNGVSLQ